MSPRGSVVVVSPYRTEYGPRRVLEHVCQALTVAGYQPVLVVPDGATRTATLEQMAVEIIETKHISTFPRTMNVGRLSSFFGEHLEAAREIEKVVRSHRARAVYSISEAIFCSGLAARRAGVPSVTHAIGMSIQRPAWGANVYIRLLDRLTDQFIACSSAVAAMFARYGVDDGKCTVVHNGISVDEVVDSADRVTGITHDGPRVGMVAAFDPRKGHELFVEAAATVLERTPNARFYVVGGVLDRHPESVEFERRVRRLIGELQIADDVELVGFVPSPDVYSWIRALDVVVVPSRTEAFAHALLEAMACARPVVATKIEGNLDALVHGHSGLYVEPRPAALADAVSALLADPARAETMGDAAYDRVRRLFDLNVTIPANAHTIERLLELPPA